MKIAKLVLLSALSLLLTACNGFFDKDNTQPPNPLTSFRTEARVLTLWSTNTNGGVGREYLKLTPAVGNHYVYTASSDGVITATDKLNGKQIWRTDTRTYVNSGPGTQGNLVVIGGRNGDVLALDGFTGKPLWKTFVSSEILATPAVSQRYVIVKSIDGRVTALATSDGHTLWHYQQTEPTLILRRASTPIINQDHVFVGFENGNLAKLSLTDGNAYWEQPLAIPEGSFAIQRMIDVDADPYILNHRVYAGTYQGRINALEYSSGRNIWNHDISTYAGLTADRDRVYVSDAKSHVWSFDADTGRVDWRQLQLEARNITGPAILGNYIVIGDSEGYLHWLNKQDGHFAARVYTTNSGILATPVVDNFVLYVLNQNGRLSAYSLG